MHTYYVSVVERRRRVGMLGRGSALHETISDALKKAGLLSRFVSLRDASVRTTKGVRGSRDGADDDFEVTPPQRARRNSLRGSSGRDDEDFSARLSNSRPRRHRYAQLRPPPRISRATRTPPSCVRWRDRPLVVGARALACVGPSLRRCVVCVGAPFVASVFTSCVLCARVYVRAWACAIISDLASPRSIDVGGDVITVSSSAGLLVESREASFREESSLRRLKRAGVDLSEGSSRDDSTTVLRAPAASSPMNSFFGRVAGVVGGRTGSSPLAGKGSPKNGDVRKGSPNNGDIRSPSCLRQGSSPGGSRTGARGHASPPLGVRARDASPVYDSQ